MGNLFFPDRNIVEKIKNDYLPGTKVKLISMNDPYTAVPAGTIGTVINVDDAGTIHCSWEGYGRLGIAYGEDSCEKIEG